MSTYELIDPVLSRWAVANAINWYTDYKGEEVRTFYINFNRRDRVQIAVDVPDGEKTTIRIGQNQRGLPRLNRSENISVSVAALAASLDKALLIATDWAAS